MTDSSKLVGVGAICLLLGGSLGYLGMQAGKSPLGGGAGGSVDRDEVAQIVKQVINENPEVILQSLQNMQKRAYEQQRVTSAEGLKDHMDEIKASKTSPVVGAADAPITIVQFFDYHCGFCKRMTPVVKEVLEKHKDVKIVFKEFPILSEDSNLASRASIAVFTLAPAKYFDYHQALIAHQGEYTQAALNQYAEKVGISSADLEKAMQSDAVKKEIEQVAALARSIGVQGTPGIVIGEELIPGAMPFEDMDRRIKALRENKAS
jgi:protein-disulfide isomerase